MQCGLHLCMDTRVIPLTLKQLNVRNKDYEHLLNNL